MKQREIKCPKTLSGKHYWKKENGARLESKKMGDMNLGYTKSRHFVFIVE